MGWIPSKTSNMLENGAMEHGPSIGDFPMSKPPVSIDRGFSIAMFDYQRVYPKCVISNLQTKHENAS